MKEERNKRKCRSGKPRAVSLKRFHTRRLAGRLGGLMCACVCMLSVQVLAQETNLLIGHGAGKSVPEYQNTFIGINAGAANTKYYNTFLGYNAGLSNNGASNTIIGHEAASYSSGDHNTYIGLWAGANVSGTGNTMIGPAPGFYMAGGDYNIIIGNYYGGINSEFSGKLYINNDMQFVDNPTPTPLIYGQFYNEADNIQPQVGINIEATDSTLTVGGGFHVTGGAIIDGILSASQIEGAGLSQWDDYAGDESAGIVYREGQVAIGEHITPIPNIRLTIEGGVAITTDHDDDTDLSSVEQPAVLENYQLLVQQGIATEQFFWVHPCMWDGDETDCPDEWAVSWPDFVFTRDYDLPALSEVQTYITLHKHLPGVPSALDIQSKGGYELHDMNKIFLQKIEELTLYTLKQQEQLKQQDQQLQEMKQELDDYKALAAQVEQLKQAINKE